LFGRLFILSYRSFTCIDIFRMPWALLSDFIHRYLFLAFSIKMVYKKYRSSRRRKLAITAIRFFLLALKRVLRYGFRIFRYSSRVAVHIHWASIATRPTGFLTMLRHRFTDTVLYVATRRWTAEPNCNRSQVTRVYSLTLTRYVILSSNQELHAQICDRPIRGSIRWRDQSLKHFIGGNWGWWLVCLRSIQYPGNGRAQSEIEHLRYDM